MDEAFDDEVEPEPGDYAFRRPQTPRELKEHILELTGDGRIVDEVKPALVLLRSRGITGERAVDWIEHAAWCARGKADAAPYFRMVIQGCVRKNGTPVELAEAEERRKAQAMAPISEADRLATSQRMEQGAGRFDAVVRARDERMARAIERYRAAPEAERARIVQRASYRLDRTKGNTILFEAICASMFDAESEQHVEETEAS